MNMINVVNEAINRKLASMSFTNLVTGKVESLDPLKIKINDRIVIGQSFIEPMSLGLNDYSPSSALPLSVGETIQMIRYNNGQRFYILGKAAGSAEIEAVDYTTQVVNKPKLVTAVADPLEPGEEPIAEEVLLHKIAKSGCYNDLCMKPKINTTNTTSLDVNEAEELNETINLHKISKTGNYKDLNNRPKINGIVLEDDKTSDDLGLQPKGDYQETLVAGKNMKTINGESLLGAGDIMISGGDGGLIDVLPVGTMLPYGSSETPDNWLSCDGSEVSRTTYSHLFAVIGTSYGEGDGSTTFNLPDKRGRVSVGYDPDQELFAQVGAHVGANTHTLTIDEMPNHSHDMDDSTYGNQKNVMGIRSDGGGGTHKVPQFQYTNSYSVYRPTWVGGGKAHSILQASEVDHWIIKAYPLSNPEGYLDSLPIGSIIDYEGDEIPEGFEQVIGYNRDILRASLSENTTMPTDAYATIPFDVISADTINYNGTFSLKDGVVTIHADDVLKARVYVQVLDTAWLHNSLYLIIKKNGNAMKRLYLRDACNAHLEAEFPIKKGDQITTEFYSSSETALTLSNSIEYTQLIVSVT